MSRRDQIRMTDKEVRKFLRESKTAILCSNGVGGLPHPMPMWYVMEDDLTLRMTTYVRSQKVRNLGRDSRVAVLVESGVEYSELKGVVLYGKAEITTDLDQIIDTLLMASRTRVGDDPAEAQAIRTGMRGNAAKRVLIRVRPDRVVSWDHSKLGGTY